MHHHIRHTRVNTSVDTVYDIFWFSWFKNLYVLCFKIYMYYKRNTGGLWLRPSPTMFRESFRPPISFKEKKIHKHIIVYLWVDIMYWCIYIYICYDSADLFKMFSTPSSFNLVGFCLLLPSLSMWFCSLHPFPLFQVKCWSSVYAVVVISFYFST